jgi:hypothetical protein
VRPTGRLGELAAAGILEPVPGADAEYRFSEYGMKRREKILEREAVRIERERHESRDVKLSETARSRLWRHLAGDRAVRIKTSPAVSFRTAREPYDQSPCLNPSPER